MIQKIFEIMLLKSLNNIKLYNFLVRTFPKMNKKFVDRLDREVSNVFITQEKLDEMSKNVWDRLCIQIKEDYGEDISKKGD